MKPNPLKDGALTENSVGLGTVTRKMVRARAVELAAIDGRSAQETSQSDRQAAQRELTGEPDTDPQAAALESAPESERWDPVPGSTGHKVPAAASEDEDEEGRSDNERLVEEGIAGAQQDQRLQSAREAAAADTTARPRNGRRDNRPGQAGSLPPWTRRKPMAPGSGT